MAHPVIWRGKLFFYPIGNTSAVCLTQDLCPSEKADILLLGCGDPRHILYTVYTNTDDLQKSRELDITCCDVEGAVIARNVILFTCLADEGAAQRLPQLWNILFHFFLDKVSLDLLASQCRKLIELSGDLDSWNNGPYGHFLRMCTADTLAELRHFWQLYVKTTSFSPSQAKEFESAFAADVQAGMKKSGNVTTASRSAGPMSIYFSDMAATHYDMYWKFGVCSAVPTSESDMTHANPTLAYSMAGDKFAVHYGTDPLACFHLAEGMASVVGTTPEHIGFSLITITNACVKQFSTWCISVSNILRSQHPSAPSPIIIRCFVGDALSLCQALRYCSITKSISTPFPVAPWKHAFITLDSDAYGSRTQSPAPTTFNVIDTSNLLDHLGILNILAVTAPIIQRTPSATLYMEGLVGGSDTGHTSLQKSCGDIATLGLLIGLIPASFVTQFTTQSNMHNIMLMMQEDAPRIHGRLAWKLIGGAEKLVTDLDRPIDIAPEQLAGALFNIYLNMFSHENVVQKMAMVKELSRSRKLVTLSGFVHYNRRSFVEILGVVKRRVITEWEPVMNMLHSKIQNDRTLLTGMNYYQDLCCQLHLLGVFTVGGMSLKEAKGLLRVERPVFLRDWKTLPQTVCVVLIVPRDRLHPLLPELDKAGTPVLQCDVSGTATANTFSSIHAVFGTVKVSGKGDAKIATIEEDVAGRHGASSLVVWFRMPSISLMNERHLMVGLTILATPATTFLTLKMGLSHSLFRADLGDEEYVHILRQCPGAVLENTEEYYMQTSGLSVKTPGACVFVTLDKECQKPLSFTARVDIVDPEMKASLTNGATPSTNKVSMHSITIALGDNTLPLSFPLPIDVNKIKLRIARKSLYIEVILPPKLALGGTDLMDIFPVIPYGGDLLLWNMHRVNLDRCVPCDITNKESLAWINPHVYLMISEREKNTPEGMMSGSTLLDVKRTLHSIFSRASGVSGGKPPLCYSLRENGESFIAFFITDLRLDLGSHTLVADAWVMPFAFVKERSEAFIETFMSLNLKDMQAVVYVEVNAEERKAWMHLLVATTERCRTWEHKPNCEYRVQGAIPLSVDLYESPICLCGAGVGSEVFVKKYPMLRLLAPWVTRAAISPLFALSYLETICSLEDGPKSVKTPRPPVPAPTTGKVCATCGTGSGTLLACSGCKDVKYCSKSCQREDWKRHKKLCGT